MTRQILTIWLAILILALPGLAPAQEACSCESGVADDYCAAGDCSCANIGCCEGKPCGCDGAYNWFSIGLIGEDLDAAERESYYNYGYYPEDWVTSGRIHLSWDWLSGERFEVRWQDMHYDQESGRYWIRGALWPLTLEYDGYVYQGRAWDHYSGPVGWQRQEFLKDEFKLRLHQDDFDNLTVKFETAEMNRGAGRLFDFDYKRLTAQYNFESFNGKMKGQIRQVGNQTTAIRLGPGKYNTDTTYLKLDAPLGDNFSVFGRGRFTEYDYEDLPDPEMSAHDYRVGLTYHPDLEWEFTADYHAKENPTDNTVTSHVESLDEYSVSANYSPCGGGWYEAGFSHTKLDYLDLNRQDPNVNNLIHGAAVVLPGQVAGALTSLNPEQDKYWFNFSHGWDRFSVSGGVEYKTGDTPGTSIVAANSPSLYYGDQINDTLTLAYDADARNQFSVTRFNQESSTSDRNRNFDFRYLEGAWTHYCGSDSYMTLAYRDTEMDLDTIGINNNWTTDDTTWMVNFNQDLDKFSYALDLNFTDGTGTEEYEQTGAGLDIDFTSWGPVGMRIDWFNRDYAAYPAFDTEALEVMVDYKFKF